MFVGGCAGSTAGGFKVSRVGMLACGVKKEVRRLLRPHNANIVKFEGIVCKKCFVCIFYLLIVHNLIKKEVQLWKTNKQSNVMCALVATTAKTTTANLRPSQLQTVTTVQLRTTAVTTKSAVSKFCQAGAL